VGGAYKVAANVKVRPIGAMGTMAARLTLIYVVVAALWILVSDQVLVALVSDHTLLMKLEVMKGWAFVSVTAALLFFLMRRETGHWMAEKGAREKAEALAGQQEAARRKRELERRREAIDRQINGLRSDYDNETMELRRIDEQVGTSTLMLTTEEAASGILRQADAKEAAITRDKPRLARINR